MRPNAMLLWLLLCCATPLFSSCTPPAPVVGAECQANPRACHTCESADWCGGQKDRFKWICKADHTCQRVCMKHAECLASEACEDALCRPLGCGSDAECGAGRCLAGSCVADPRPAPIASCFVEPSRVLLAGGDAQLSVTALDASGIAQPFVPGIAWRSESPALVAVSGDGAIAAVQAGSGSGDVLIHATIGDVVCDTAVVQTRGAVRAGHLRVRAFDVETRRPVADALVLVEGTRQSALTDVHGEAELEGVADVALTISLFHRDFAYVTAVGVHRRDLVVPLAPGRVPALLRGQLAPGDFDLENNLRGNIHLSLTAGGLPRNLFDLSLEDQFGPTIRTTFRVSPSMTLDLPGVQGLSFGMGSEMYRPEWAANVAQGRHPLWTLTGNEEFAYVTAALGPSLGGAAEPLHDFVGPFLEVFQRLESGVYLGLEGPATATAPAPPLPPTHPRRLRVDVEIPQLPVPPAPLAPVPLANVIVLGGATTPEGFVPLGIGVGNDVKGAYAEGRAAADGFVDVKDERFERGHLVMRVAPRHSGMEAMPWQFLAFATTLEKLDLPADETPGDLTASRRLVSAVIARPAEIPYAQEHPPQVTFVPFLTFDARPLLLGRRFEQVTGEPRARLHRLSIGDRAQGEWFVWFDEGPRPAAFEIPLPPEGFDDRFAKPLAPGSALGARTRFESLAMRAGSTVNLDEALTPGGATLDDLSSDVEAFSIRELQH